MIFLPIIGSQIDNLEYLGRLSKGILTLADYVGDNHYTAFYRKHDFIIIDNMVYEESKSVDVDVLVQKAKTVNATEIIAPDILYNGTKTITSVYDFISKLSKDELKRFNIMAVAQGVDFKDLLLCFTMLHGIPEVSTIGLSCLAIPYVMEAITNTGDVMINRITFVDWIIKKRHIENLAVLHKQYHLLGLGTNAAELIFMKGLCRSCDSSLPFTEAQSNRTITDSLNNYRPKVRKHTLDVKLLGPQLELAKQNIITCMNMSGGI